MNSEKSAPCTLAPGDKDGFRWPSENLLALSRIAFGLSFFVHYLSIISWTTNYYSYDVLGNLKLFESRHLLWAVFALLILSASMVIVGAFTRVSLVTLLICHSIFLLANNLVLWGWGYISFHFAWLLLLIDPGRAWSIDAGYFGKRKQKSWNYYFLYLLLITQVALIYMVSNIERLFNDTWQTGEVLYGLLHDPLYSRVARFDWRSLSYIVQPSHYLFWFFEICGAFIFLFPTPRIIIAGLLALHFLLAIVGHIQTWSILMLGFLSLLLIQKSEQPQIFSDLRKKLLATAFCLFIVIQNLYLPHHFPQISQTINRTLSFVRFNFTNYTKVFQFHMGRISYCVLAVGFKGEMAFVTYRSPIELCTGEQNELVKGEMEVLFDRALLRPADRAKLNQRFCRLWPGFDQIQLYVFSRYNLYKKFSSKVEKYGLVSCQEPAQISKPIQEVKTLMQKLEHPPKWREYLKAVASDLESQKKRRSPTMRKGAGRDSDLIPFFRIRTIPTFSRASIF